LARVLALDWDPPYCQLVAANVTRQGLETGKSVVWSPDESLSPKTAESLGRKLREFMAAQAVPAAPVVICIGRDRVILKELSYPPTTPQDEPNLVRFQATKDLADMAEDVVLDYAAMPGSNGERQALAVILRREVMTSFQQLCKAAGLKLQTVVPRPFGMGGCLNLARARGKNVPAAGSPEDGVAMLLVGRRWAELSLFRGETLLFSRSLGVGPSLPAEVRRSLAVLSSQTQGGFPRPAPRTLYYVGGGDANGSLQALQEAVGLPVVELDPLTETEKTQAENRGTLAGNLGLLQSLSRGQVPVNLASPREPAPVVDQGRRKRFMTVALTFLGLLLGVLLSQVVLGAKRAEIEEVETEKAALETSFQRLDQDRLDLEALKIWELSAIPWLDELYDLAARFPREAGLRVTHVKIEPIQIQKPSTKDRFTIRMTLQGIVPAGKRQLVDRFIDALRDPHLRARVERVKGGSSQGFSIQLEIARQLPAEYETRLIVPVRTGGVR
jgi:hypothetical protein